MGKITKHYGELVFDSEEMKKRLTSETFNQYMDTVTNGASLNEAVAVDIARAVKDWSIENGVTHFTHWFQPQRSGTAEKHDAFIDYNSDGQIIEKFSTNQLINLNLMHHHFHRVAFVQHLKHVVIPLGTPPHQCLFVMNLTVKV